MTDAVDVVVTDGFTGNVVLKTLEGGMKALDRRPARRLRPSRSTRRTPRRCCRRCCRSTTTLDPDTYGGAVLLGVDGVCVICHGSSGAHGDASTPSASPARWSSTDSSTSIDAAVV